MLECSFLTACKGDTGTITFPLGVSHWPLSSLRARTVTLPCLSSSLPPLQSPPSVRHRAVVHSCAPPWICPVPLETSLCAFPLSISLVCPPVWRKTQQEERLNEVCRLQGEPCCPWWAQGRVQGLAQLMSDLPGAS